MDGSSVCTSRGLLSAETAGPMAEESGHIYGILGDVIALSGHSCPPSAPGTPEPHRNLGTTAISQYQRNKRSTSAVWGPSIPWVDSNGPASMLRFGAHSGPVVEYLNVTAAICSHRFPLPPHCEMRLHFLPLLPVIIPSARRFLGRKGGTSLHTRALLHIQILLKSCIFLWFPDTPGHAAPGPEPRDSPQVAFGTNADLSWSPSLCLQSQEWTVTDTT